MLLTTFLILVDMDESKRKETKIVTYMFEKAKSLRILAKTEKKGKTIFWL